MISSWLNQPYHRSQLPNDAEKLKDIIDELVPLVWHLRGQVEELQQRNHQLEQQNLLLQQQVSELQRKRATKLLCTSGNGAVEYQAANCRAWRGFQ